MTPIVVFKVYTYSKLFKFGLYSFVEKVKATGKIPPIIRGLISFKWEDEITPNSIKFLKKTLRNLARNLADSRIPASQRIYDELGTMNIQTPSNFCTKVIHNPVRYYLLRKGRGAFIYDVRFLGR